MRRQTVWALLFGAGLLAVAGTSAAQSAEEAPADEAPRCEDGAASDLLSVTDEERRLVRDTSRHQDVEIDEDDVLLAIALANNGATDVDWNSIRDFEMTTTKFHEESRKSDFDREDVFSALALGVRAGPGSLDALSCVSDGEWKQRVTITKKRVVDLDQDDVLLAIALSNAIGGELRLEDIADIRESEHIETETDREVRIDRDDAFLALALGAGEGE